MQEHITHDGRNHSFTKEGYVEFLLGLFESGEQLKNDIHANEAKSKIFKMLTPMDEMQKAFDYRNNRMIDSAKNLEDSAKKVTGKARDLHQKTNDALDKINKSIDLNTLEKKVILLERVADAMERLNDLQQTGRLEKIISSIK